ncbi:MAG: DUF4136 domain-containing protein [Burkholderiales bacterium]|nr:DUF4136 domain-containing protein [Burkholderiales bacterium]
MIKLVWVAALVALAPGLAQAAEVRTALETGADPAKFRTYSFVQPDPKAKGAIKDSRVRHRLEQLVGRQLMDRGYTPAAPGQVGEIGVNLAGHVEPKQKVFVVGRPGPYDYGWGRTEIGGYRIHDYREGTLFVDVVDLAGKRLLWRAHITEALTQGYSEENFEKVNRALAEAFKTLPSRK